MRDEGGAVLRGASAVARLVNGEPADTAAVTMSAITSTSLPRRLPPVLSVGRIGDVGPAQRTHLAAPPHPRHEQQTGDHRIDAAQPGVGGPSGPGVSPGYFCLS